MYELFKYFDSLKKTLRSRYGGLDEDPVNLGHHAETAVALFQVVFCGNANILFLNMGYLKCSRAITVLSSSRSIAIVVHS